MSRQPAASRDTPRRAGREAPGRHGLPESPRSRSLLALPPLPAPPPRRCSGPDLCLGPCRELRGGVRRGTEEEKIIGIERKRGLKGLPGRSLAERGWCYPFSVTYGNLPADPQLKEPALRPLFPANFCVKC